VNTDRLLQLQQRLGYHFRSAGLLRQALTHSSVSSDSGRNNERLEFLGDRVLALLVADLLLQNFPAAQEGDLALRLNALVRSETCAAVAGEIELGACLNLAVAEAASGGRDKPAILSDACEALIGALYLDGGMDAARGFVRAFWSARMKNEAEAPEDAKSALQEWSQARRLGTPLYKEISREGPDHAPQFMIEVRLPGYPAYCGKGPSKRDAERDAAQIMLRALCSQAAGLENQ